MVGASGVAVAGLIAPASGGLVLCMQPEHPAWPVFLMGAFAAGMQTGLLGAAALTATIVLTLCGVSDGRYAGVSMRIRATPFARNDDRLWTPLTALRAFGAAATLLV